MAKKKLDVILIGAGHNGLVAAAYLAKAGKQVLVLEREEQVGGILRATQPAPGFTAPGLVHTVGRLRSSIVKDLKLDRFGYATVSPPVRMHAPMPDGSAVTFWGDAAKTAEGIKARNPQDAQAYLDFDKKVRAIASFLAYIAVATPPDPKSPSLADAIMGLKLGKAFRDLGGKTGREAVRALPMSVADLVQEVFDDEAIRGPLSTRGILYTAMGPWATGTAQVFLNDRRRYRRRRGRHRRVREGRHGRARERARAGRHRSRGADPHRRRGRRDPQPRHASDRRDAGRRRRAGRAADRVGGRPEAHRASVRPGDARARRWSGRRATSASPARRPA